MFPDNFCVWNEKPKTVLPFLKLDILPERFFKYQIDAAEEYYQCVQALGIIKEEMTKFGKDFIDLDIMFLHIHQNIMPKEQKLVEPTKEERETQRPPRIIIDSHESALDYHRSSRLLISLS